MAVGYRNLNTSGDYQDFVYVEDLSLMDIKEELATESTSINDDKGQLISLICRQAARYYVALVIVFGILGNLGCLICYRRSEELKRYRSTGYLMALALSDLTFLLCLSFVWLKSIGINWHDAQVVCQASVYASNASIFLSAWYVMALTGEMAFALRRPYSAYAAAVDASKTVFIRIFVVTIVGCAVNSWTLALTRTGNTIFDDDVSVVDTQFDIDDPHDFDTTTKAEFYYETSSSSSFEMDDPDYAADLNNDTYPMPPFAYEAGCHISSNNQLLHRTFVLLDIAFTYSIPLLVTLLLNCYIGYKLIQAGRQRRHMSKSVLMATRKRTAIAHQSQTGLQQNSVQMTFPKEGSFNRTRRQGQQLERCPFTAFQLNRLNDATRSSRQLIITKPSFRNKETTVSSLLIAKSIAYLIFNTPSCAHRIWSMLKRQAAVIETEIESESETTANSSGSQNENWIQLIIYMLFYTQFSMNFLLYSWHAYSRRRCGTTKAKGTLLRSAFHSPAPCF